MRSNRGSYGARASPSLHHSRGSPSGGHNSGQRRRYADSPSEATGYEASPAAGSKRSAADRRSNSPALRRRGDSENDAGNAEFHSAKRRREDESYSRTLETSGGGDASFPRSRGRDRSILRRNAKSPSPSGGSATHHRNRGRLSDEEDERRSSSPYQRASRRSNFYGGRDKYRDASPVRGEKRSQYSRRGGGGSYYYGGRHRDYDDERRDTHSRRRSSEHLNATEHTEGKATQAPIQSLTEEERKRKEIEDARRDDLTVLVVNLSLKATEKDIWQFFTKHAGKVRDIQLIKDTRSGKSKGIGYVEFHDAESVLKSLNLTGQCVLNQPIRVQASQAEKNRAAKAAKQQQAELAAQGPTKIYVGGLVDTLAGITSDELRQLFSPFGSILQIDIPKDPYTGRSRGYAFVQFKNAQEAREAMTAMHGFDIGGKQIKVGFAGEEQPRTTSTSSTVDGSNGVDLDKIADDHDDRLLHGGAMTRLQLSQKLQQKSSDQIPLLSSAAAQLMSAVDIQSTLQSAVKPAVQQTTNILCLSNMFTRQEVTDEGIDMLDEVLDDVKNECSRFGEVMDLWVDREALNGKIYVKFVDLNNATPAFKGLNGRFFGGAAIVVTYITEEEWKQLAS